MGQKFIHSTHHGLSREGLTFSQISGFSTPIPPIKEQEKIASILSMVDDYINQEKNGKSQLENLKRGLVQRLLTGKIRVKV